MGVEACIGLQGGMGIKGRDPKDLWKRVCTQICGTLSIYALGALGLLFRLFRLHRGPNYFRMGFSRYMEVSLHKSVWHPLRLRFGGFGDGFTFVVAPMQANYFLDGFLRIFGSWFLHNCMATVVLKWGLLGLVSICCSSHGGQPFFGWVPERIWKLVCAQLYGNRCAYGLGAFGLVFNLL